MVITHCNYKDYNAHAVDTGNTRNKALNISKIHNKPAAYPAFKGIICTSCQRSKMV